LEADRHKDRTPSTFNKIHVSFQFKGDLEPKRVKRAVDLGITKYCSVTKILEESCEITYEVKIDGEIIK
jgi:putative redox protein